jgi:phytoene dehydrogenase-like protein
MFDFTSYNDTQLEGKTFDVIVAGGGHNGLVSACYLAKGGLKVLVVEAHDTPGGMTSTNPMAPEAPEHIINEASIHASLFRLSPIDAELELGTKFGLRQRQIDPCHIQLMSAEDNESIALWNDPMKTAEEIRYFSPKDAKAWLQMSEVIDAAFKIAMPMMLTSPVKPSFSALMKAGGSAVKHWKHLKPIIDLVTNSHAGAVEELFESDIVRAALLTGLPFMDFKVDTSAFAMVYMAALQSTGITMFEGGTGAFPAALIRCLKHHGGEIKTGAPIAEMIARDGAIKGVRLMSGDEIFASKGVITAFSPKMVLNHMLPEGLLSDKMQTRAKRIPTNQRGVGDYKLNIALKGRIAPTRHINWRKQRGWSEDMRLPTLQWQTYQQALQAYDACIQGEVPDQIGGLSQITTAFDPSMAPEGCDTYWFWSGLIPSQPRADWNQVRDEITAKTVRDAAIIYEGIEDLEIARRPLAPPDIEKRFFAIDGSVYHVEPYLTRFGAGRPMFGMADYKTPIPGLYLSGSGTHPSAGISGMPGRNAALAFVKNEK